MTDQDNDQNGYDEGEQNQHDGEAGMSAEDVADFNEEARGDTPRGPLEKQDLHESFAHKPDKNWPAGSQLRMQPVSMQPTPERLARRSQFVSVRNSSDRLPGVHGRINPQTHIILDRHQRGIQLQPGETRHNVEMLVSDIDFFVRAGLPGRRNDFGQPLPRHPVEVLNVDTREIAKAAAEDNKRKLEARRRKQAQQNFAHGGEVSAVEPEQHDEDQEHGERQERPQRRPIGRGKKRS